MSSRDGHRRPSVPDADRSETESRSIAERRPRILVAEDHDDTREALGMMLELHGYEVLLANDGDDALRLALDEEPDVIVTDFDMPRKDGAGLAREIRSMAARFGRVPILVLSALGRPLVEEAFRAGADAYMSKPVDFQRLIALLRSFVRR